MTCHPSHGVRARWLMIEAGRTRPGGWLQVRGGRIAEVGDGRPPTGTRDVGDVVLLHGLVNAHTHLELSWMAGRVPPSPSMEAWIRALMDLRRSGPRDGEPDVHRACVAALESAVQSGTALVGDISNSLMSVGPLRAAGMPAVVFHEILGFSTADPAGQVRDAQQRLRDALAPSVAAGSARQSGAVVGHAPYSTSPDLFRELARRHDGPTPLTVHLAESPEEMAFLRHATGPFRDLLERLEVWNPAWRPPGGHPVRYLQSLGYLKPGTLIVHGVHLSAEDLDLVRASRAVLVTCPRSNAWVGGGVPPLARLYGAGLDVAVGTDSLASVGTLSVFDELAEMRRLAPEVDAARLLDSATRVGATALGFGATMGRLAEGCVPRMAAVRVSPELSDPRDVEEYLVSGVRPEDVSLLDLATT